MPNQFEMGGGDNGDDRNLNLFDGTSLEKATALRDILMNLAKVVEMPENKLYHPSIQGTK